MKKPTRTRNGKFKVRRLKDGFEFVDVHRDTRDAFKARQLARIKASMKVVVTTDTTNVSPIVRRPRTRKVA